MSGSIYDWSKTAADNDDADGDIAWSDSMNPKQVDNSGRQMMGRVAEILADLGGTVTTGGSANAQTATVNSGFAAYKTGLLAAFKAGYTNTGATTLNVNSIGAKAVRKDGDVALVGGEIKENGVYLVVYNAAANSAAGAWMLLNPTMPAVIAVIAGLTPTDGNFIVGDGSTWVAESGDTALDSLGATTTGKALVKAASQSAGRTALGLGTSATVDTGTSGAAIPLLNGANTWSTSQTVRSALNVDYTDSTHYGLVSLRNSTETRGAYIGWGNGGTTVNFTGDNATTLAFTGWTATTMAGTLSVTGDITYSSDRNLKTGIRSIGKALDRLLRVRGTTFKKKGQKRRSIGVIAQDVQAVFPEAVRKGEDGYLSVVAGGLDGAIIEALREIVVRLEALEAAK